MSMEKPKFEPTPGKGLSKEELESLEKALGKSPGEMESEEFEEPQKLKEKEKHEKGSGK